MTDKGSLKIGIFIGLDMLGKTPLIELVKQQNPMRTLVRQVLKDPRKMTPLEVERAALSEMAEWPKIKERDCTVLYDRFPYPDEFVYRVGINEIQMYGWENLLSEWNVTIFYVYSSSYEKYLEKIGDERDPIFPTHEMDLYQKLVRRYDFFLETTRLPIVNICADDQEFDHNHGAALYDILQQSGAVAIPESIQQIRSDRSDPAAVQTP